MTNTYTSPALKVIRFESRNELCVTSTGNTESFTVNNNNYSDEDFE